MLIIPEYLFEMETGRFGRIRVRDLSVGAVTEIRKRVPDYNKRPRKDITVASASVLCLDDENRPIDGTQLSEAELAEFAEKLLETIPRVVIVNDKLIDESPRKEKENSVDYCGRAIADEISSFHNQISRLVEKPVVISAIKELDMLTDKIRQSANLSKYYGLTSAADNMRSALKDMERVSMIDSPLVKEFREMEAQRNLAHKFLKDSKLDSATMKICNEMGAQRKLAHEVLEGSKFDSTAMKICSEMEEQRKLEHNARGDSGAASMRFKSSFEPMKIPMPPPNPVYKTNEKLDDLTEQVEIFTGALPKHLAASVSALKEGKSVV